MMDDSKVKAIQNGIHQPRCQQAFEDLKKAVTKEPVLALPDHTKVFEVHTDASDFAIGGVLMQERHPIAFESLKTDNVATSYFQTQKKLSPKQARWQDFLAEFDYTLEYKLGSANHVADALSRKAELASMTSQPQGDIMDLLREGLQHDPVAKSLIALAHERKTKRFGWRTAYSTLRGDDSTCLKRLWDNVIMDFIIALPKSKDSGSIIVVVDRFSNDRNPRFTGKFWIELFKLMGSELHFSTSFHPQTDGQTERVNALLELYLRHFYKDGDMVLVKLLPQQFKSLRPVHKGLVRRYEEPFPILGKVGKVSYRVELPPRLKIHLVFHRAPTTVVTSYDKEVEHVLVDRVIRRRGVPPATEYLVKWKGLPESEASWEPADALWQFQE
ncbi:hypothetical protein AAG906_001736 [Vitis piasezkii]